MKIIYNLLVVLIIIFVSTGFTSVNQNECVKEGVILKFNPKKCMGCWGWTIKVGEDTIKTDHLPFSQEIAFNLKFPARVRLTVAEIMSNTLGSDFDYYEIECIELISDSNCTEIVLYDFIGGKPEMGWVRTSQDVAKKWGFTIHYEFGSCGNTDADQKIAEEYFQKSKAGQQCLAERFGSDWRERFDEQVRNERE